MAGHQDLSEFKRCVTVGVREMEHPPPRWRCNLDFHECTTNIGNPIKHQIYDIAAAGKRSCKNGTDERERHATLPQIAADFI
ncbi:hypothetical protein TNCV_4499491 [Trichonephila clavipes]|nr:hypothetical protein TNCV_4499491 [Trichonephila clavipes]